MTTPMEGTLVTPGFVEWWTLWLGGLLVEAYWIQRRPMLNYPATAADWWCVTCAVCQLELPIHIAKDDDCAAVRCLAYEHVYRCHPVELARRGVGP